MSDRSLGYLNLSLQTGKNFKTNTGHVLTADLGVPGCVGVLFVFESEEACRAFIDGPFATITYATSGLVPSSTKKEAR